MNILEKANEIVNKRSEEKARMYGPFDETMERMARMQTDMTGKLVTPQECYLSMVAMKLARQAHAHKEDNLLDAVAYLGALNNYEERRSRPELVDLPAGAKIHETSRPEDVIRRAKQVHSLATQRADAACRNLEPESKQYQDLTYMVESSFQLFRLIEEMLDVAVENKAE